jgi:DNA-binding transcriptional ArsR family regulator
MKAKIVLLDGVVVEADGTPEEIAVLSDALRKCHSIIQLEGGDHGAPVGTVQTEVSPDDTSGNVGPGDEGFPEGAEEHDAHKTEGLDRGPRRGDNPEAVEDRPEEIGISIRGDSGTPGPPPELVVRELADQFRLLADSTRLQILTLLLGGEHNVSELCEALGGQAQPAVSHHLALLRVSGLVRPSREGKFIFYALTDQGRTLTEAIGQFNVLDVTGAVELFRQAADPTRLQILLILSQLDRNVSELCSDIGDQGQPAVSHHLAKMRKCGLIGARRTGKFRYYSLRESGRELSRLVAPLMAARTRACDSPAGEAFDPETIDFSIITDEWMDPSPSLGRDEGQSETPRDGGAPPTHLLCRRVLMMVQDLHRRGYERLRVAPGLSPSGLHWRCSIVPVGCIRRDHGALTVGEDGSAALYRSGQGAKFFKWADAADDSPVALAGKLLERFPDLASKGRGSDPGYAHWYAEMLRATAPYGLIYAYADWDLPDDHIPALGCTAEVKIPLPPPGTADSGR